MKEAGVLDTILYRSSETVTEEVDDDRAKERCQADDDRAGGRSQSRWTDDRAKEQ